MLSQGCHSNTLSANEEESYRTKKKHPPTPPPKLACERCVYIELLDKVVQHYMQPSVVRLPLLPGMPPTSVWVMAASAVSSSPPPCAEPAVAGCCCSTSWSSPRLPGAEALLLATPPPAGSHSCSSSSLRSLPLPETPMGQDNGTSLEVSKPWLKKCFLSMCLQINGKVQQRFSSSLQGTARWGSRGRLFAGRV